MPQSQSVPVSVLIPTLNEEINLPACLASVAWAEEIVVLDSLSTDNTVAIAEAAGAAVVTRAFDSFAAHKNWALDHIKFRHDWVLILDADERVPEALAVEIALALTSPGDLMGYHLARRTFFRGKWIRHGGAYPDYNLRLFRRSRGRYEDRLVHEHVILDGPAGYLKTPLDHDQDQGMERYYQRHNLYTTLEAVEIVRARRGIGQVRLAGKLFNRGPQGRRALKDFAQHYLPLRPVFLFFYMYLLKGGFLDGRIGYEYFFLKMVYDYLTDIKVSELERDGSVLNRQWRDLIEPEPSGPR